MNKRLHPISFAKEAVCNSIDRLQPELLELSRKLWAKPELSGGEREAQAALCAYLERYGFEVERGVTLETDFRAAFPSGSKSRPAVSFLAEYDALPGLGHACGHNLIAAASVGAAAGTSSVFEEHWGRLVVLGTPAEEKGGGKVRMARAGAFEDLEAALMFHPNCRTKIMRPTLAMVMLEAKFHGRTAHAAANPHLGRNALDGVILAFNNINALRQQIRPDARIHGIITHGGQAPNIIPDLASAQFMVRALDGAYLDELIERVTACLEGAAQASGTKLELVRPEPGYASFNLNYPLAELFRNNLRELGLEEDPTEETEGIASSDIGNVSQILPTLHVEIAICEPNIQAHTPEFAAAAVSALGGERMILAAKALAMTALDLLLAPENLTEIRRELHKSQPKCQNKAAYLSMKK